MPRRRPPTPSPASPHPPASVGPPAAPRPALRGEGGRLLVPLRVVPRSAGDSLALVAGELRVRVAAPPVDGAANEALLALLAARLRLPRRALALERGAAARRKVVAIAGLDAGTFWRRLGL